VKLPKYIATTPPPRETGLARAQDIGALTRTGGAEYEAIAGAGKAIQQTANIGTQIYMNRQALDDQVTMGKISTRAIDAIAEATNAIGMFDPSIGDALPDDPKNYYDGTKVNRFDSPQKEAFINTTYKDDEAKILNLAKGIKNPKTRQAWINSQLPEAYKRITAAANAKLNDYQEEIILGNAKTAASNGDVETANKWIEIAEKRGLIGPKKAAAWNKMCNKVRNEALIDNYRLQALTMGKEGLKWAVDPKNTPGISQEDRFEIQRQVNSSLEILERRAEEELKTKQEEQRDTIYKAIRANDPNVIDIIEASDLPEKEQASLVATAGKDVKPNFREYDRVADIIDGVAKGTHTTDQADEAIRNGVGKYFDVSTAISLRTKLSQNSKPGSPTKRPAVTRGHTAIEEVFDAWISSEEPEFEAESRMLQLKQQKKNDLDAWILEKDRTDEEIEKKVKFQTRIPKEKTVLNWFEKLTLPKKPSQLFPKTETVYLAEKRMKALAKENIWKEMTDEDKDYARKRFERGETVDDIIRLWLIGE